jgi:hypothetical protein
MPLRLDKHPRYKIKALSKQLRKLSFPTSPISVKLAMFAADAFDAFITGRSPTLDHAFGLSRKRGAPGWPKVRLQIAKEIYLLRKARTSWAKIQKALESRYSDTDLGTLKRTYREFRIHLMSKSVGQLLKSDSLQ